MIDREHFFQYVREHLFNSMDQSQVDGVNYILNGWEQDTSNTNKDVRFLAYMLATTYHETATKMQPISEYGHGKGHPYGVIDHTGKAPYGRGYVQCTWDYNYKKADKALGLGGKLAADYDLALQPDIAFRIMFYGMTTGMFTGKKLSDYFNATKTDPVGARKIINGTDKAGLIAGYYKIFSEALSVTK